MEETITLALRAVRRPQTGLAALLASLNSELSGRVSALYLAPDGPGKVELLAAAGPEAHRLGPPGTVDVPTCQMVRRLVVRTSTEVRRPEQDDAEPWRDLAHLGHIATPLPSGSACLLLTGGATPPAPEDLRRSSAVVALLAAALVASREVERLRHEVRSARQDRTLLAAGLQHDLRAPMTSILGCARTLRERSELLTSQERDELLDIVASQAERLSTMMSEALLEEPLGGEAPLRLRDTSVAEIARRAAGAAKVSRGGEILVEVPDLYLVTDSGRLERALLNLLDNALKYSPPDRAVHLLGEPSPEGFCFIVADCGPGVTAEIVPTLFSAYATDPNRQGGTGLGLHSVAQLAADLGGRVSYSRQEGWTRFSLSVPDRREPATNLVAAATEAP